MKRQLIRFIIKTVMEKQDVGKLTAISISIWGVLVYLFMD